LLWLLKYIRMYACSCSTQSKEKKGGGMWMEQKSWKGADVEKVWVQVKKEKSNKFLFCVNSLRCIGSSQLYCNIRETDGRTGGSTVLERKETFPFAIQMCTPTTTTTGLLRLIQLGNLTTYYYIGDDAVCRRPSPNLFTRLSSFFPIESSGRDLFGGIFFLTRKLIGGTGWLCPINLNRFRLDKTQRRK
jgi:hypothetical protein